jgi:hypothetical protein
MVVIARFLACEDLNDSFSAEGMVGNAGSVWTKENPLAEGNHRRSYTNTERGLAQCLHHSLCVKGQCHANFNAMRKRQPPPEDSGQTRFRSKKMQRWKKAGSIAIQNSRIRVTH